MASEEPHAPETFRHREEGEKQDDPEKHINDAHPEDYPVQLVLYRHSVNHDDWQETSRQLTKIISVLYVRSNAFKRRNISSPVGISVGA